MGDNGRNQAFGVIPFSADQWPIAACSVPNCHRQPSGVARPRFGQTQSLSGVDSSRGPERGERVVQIVISYLATRVARPSLVERFRPELLHKELTPLATTFLGLLIVLAST